MVLAKCQCLLRTYGAASSLYADGQAASKAGEAFFTSDQYSFRSKCADPEAAIDNFAEQWPNDRVPAERLQRVDYGKMLIKSGSQMVDYINANGDPLHLTLSWAACVSLARQGRLAEHSASGPCEVCKQTFPTLYEALAPIRGRARSSGAQRACLNAPHGEPHSCGRVPRRSPFDACVPYPLCRRCSVEPSSPLPPSIPPSSPLPSPATGLDSVEPIGMAPTHNGQVPRRNTHLVITH